MKLRIVCLAAVSLLAVQTFGQSANPTTPPPSDLGPTGIVDAMLTNAPTRALADETVGVSQGTLMRNDSTFASATLVDYTIHTNYFLRAEFDEGTSTHLIEGAGVGGGYCHTTSAARMYGVGEVRKDFSPSKWDGIVGAGIAYAPSTNGIVANFSTGAEQRMVAPINGGHSSPSSETIAYIRYSF